MQHTVGTGHCGGQKGRRALAERTMGRPGEESRDAGGEACVGPGKKGRAGETNFGVISIQLVIKIIRTQEFIQGGSVDREKEGGVDPRERQP